MGKQDSTTEAEQSDSASLPEFMALMRSAQEAERTRVARRLHDEGGQPLAAFRMNWYALEARLRAADPRIAGEIQAVAPLLDEAISVVRDVSEDLNPGVLSLGIEAAVEWQAERFQASSDIACVVDIETDQRPIEPGRATELFRIFQQALANISLHPGATTIDVRLRQEGNVLLLEIQDDGKAPGVDESIEHALGIFTLKERAARAGGVCTIAGSRIEVRLPLGG